MANDELRKAASRKILSLAFVLTPKPAIVIVPRNTMGIFRQLAEKEVDECRYLFRKAGSAPDRYTAPESITSGDDSNRFRIRERSIGATDLEEWATKPVPLPANSTTPGGDFRLLEIRKEDVNARYLGIEKKNYNMVFNAFGIKPALGLTHLVMHTDNPSEDLYMTLTKEASRRNPKGLKEIEVARDRQQQFDEAWDEIATAASLLQLHAQDMARAVAVIEIPVSLQMNILYNLIAQSDANASISLAKAAKDDSSSMKTVAVVTMTSLPATFLATVFAMPLLKWDASLVVQDNFWVYLAFTLPSTALVFTIWVIITQRETIKHLLQIPFADGGIG
ncbi:hypothetical protein B0T26DRAFT_805491 [Lasiosphaeria miniovina]|uniref:Uncharacterized protein n=1 Tax=Lasiosphaeria miniovina TaxID=1954250 RepID=A0AA40DQM2_9PEZI|nr:uncharacterized protein B0T26DRAFT_805491 [Lasiosphaeria miniovina]KAK0709866.1 hypothetical protein B0T26DRAFT_805491 [Lasiosphaeria miniovina]